MGVTSWKLDIPTDLSICNNQGCVFLRVQLMIHLPWNFDTASENNISIISLPYSNQLRGILIDQREIWRHTYIKYPHLSPNYAFGITFEWLVCWSKVHVFWKGHKIWKNSMFIKNTFKPTKLNRVQEMKTNFPAHAEKKIICSTYYEGKWQLKMNCFWLKFFKVYFYL